MGAEEFRQDEGDRAMAENTGDGRPSHATSSDADGFPRIANQKCDLHSPRAYCFFEQG
jgi:hypothetical protein